MICRTSSDPPVPGASCSSASSHRFPKRGLGWNSPVLLNSRPGQHKVWLRAKVLPITSPYQSSTFVKYVLHQIHSREGCRFQQEARRPTNT